MRSTLLTGEIFMEVWEVGQYVSDKSLMVGIEVKLLLRPAKKGQYYGGQN